MEAVNQEVLDLRKLQEIGEMPDFEWRVYYSALEYVKAGFYVVPLSRNKKHIPTKSEGHTFSYAKASNTKKTMERWFHPDTGVFAGGNIGLATGRRKGIFVIDVDRHGEEDGFITMQALEDENGKLPMGPVQATANNGFHYLFRWQDNATSSTNKIGPGVDTRGGDETSCKGHIVAWPSIVDGKEYKWLQSGPLPLVPRWVMTAMGVAWKPPHLRNQGGGRGNENIVVDDLEQKVPEDQVMRMLDHVDPDDLGYDEWLRVGMAIKSQYQGEEGLKIWDDWSKEGTRYKRGECALRWGGFAEYGAVRMGTLFHFAKEGEWEPQEDDVKIGKIHAEIESINSEYALTVVGGKVRVIRERQKHHASEQHMASYDLMDKYAFETVLENRKVIVDDETGKKAPISKIWLASESRRTYPNGIGLFPEGAPSGYYNTWEGFSVQPIKGDCRLFLKHIRQVICGGCDEGYEWVMDWLADLIQDPGNPKGTAIVMRGDEGVGKGTLANTIGSLFGGHYLHLIDDAHLTSNFNAFLMDALVVFADEITWGGNKKTSGKLKGLVTERHLVCERKGVDAQSFRNMTHLMIASNSDWVVPAGTNSRRWYVTDVLDTYRADADYFDALTKEINNGGKEALLYMLLNREITRDLRTAPVTEALKDQRNRSESSTIVNWLIELTMRGKLLAPCLVSQDDWPEAVEKGSLYDEYLEWCDKRKRHPEHLVVFFKEVRNLEFLPSKMRTPGGKRVPVAKIPTHKRLTELMKEIHNIDLGDDHE